MSILSLLTLVWILTITFQGFDGSSKTEVELSTDMFNGLTKHSTGSQPFRTKISLKDSISQSDTLSPSSRTSAKDDMDRTAKGTFNETFCNTTATDSQNFSASYAQIHGQDKGVCFEARELDHEHKNNTTWTSSQSWLKNISMADAYLQGLVISSTKHYFKHTQLSKKSCDGKCGLHVHRNYCSCKLSCLFYKTCCFDFLQQCSNMFIDKEESIIKEFSWIEQQSTACLSNVQFISSCPSLNSQNNYDSMSRLKNNNSTDNAPMLTNNDNTTKESKSASRLELQRSLMEMKYDFDQLFSLNQGTVPMSIYLNYLSQITKGGHLEDSETSLTPFEILLMQLPIEDTSTGFRYINKTIFDCNLANLSSLRILDIRLYIPTTKLLSIDPQNATIDDVLDHPLLNTWYMLGLDSFEACDKDAISMCPENYEDVLIREACQRTHIPITAFLRRKENPNDTTTSSDLRQIRYKNTFCLVCNEDLGLIESIQGAPIAKAATTLGSLITLGFSNDKRLSVHITTNTRSTMAWKTLSCMIIHGKPPYSSNGLTGSKHTGMTSNGSLDNKLYQETDAHESVRQVCTLKRCFYGDMAPPCYYPIYLGVALPQARWTLTKKQLNQLRESFNALVQSHMPKQILLPSVNDVEITHGMTVDGYPVMYHFNATFYLANFDFKLRTRSFIKLMLTNTTIEDYSYPFSQDRPYFCISMTSAKFVSWQCAIVTIPTSLRYESRDSASLPSITWLLYAWALTCQPMIKRSF